MRAIMEIRAGEGGDDAKLFVSDMLRMYQRYCDGHSIKASVLEFDESSAILAVEGPIENLVCFEAGVHRVQRVPPTEKRGRRQSSTVTVAVLPEAQDLKPFDEKELDISTFRGRGPGGQHRNTSDTGIRVVHRATKINAQCSHGRSQWQNKVAAIRLVTARVTEHLKEQGDKDRCQQRREQIGKAGRAEKVRTYSFNENRVKDARASKTLYCLDKIMDGELDRLYDLCDKEK